MNPGSSSSWVRKSSVGMTLRGGRGRERGGRGREGGREGERGEGVRTRRKATVFHSPRPWTDRSSTLSVSLHTQRDMET